MPDFTIQNPDYVRFHDGWAEAFDFYRGGRWVLNPGRAVGSVKFVRYSSDDNLKEDGETRKARYITLPSSSYLHSHIRESENRYNDRKARSVHFPLFRSVIDIYTSSALRTGATREGGLNDPVWQEYWSNCDLMGTEIDPFIRQALAYALAFGMVYAITDKPRFDNSATSKQHQMERNERPYSYLIVPTDVWDWERDEFGQFNWVKIREDMPQGRGPGEKPENIKSQFRVWFRDHWELWRESDNRKNNDKWFLYDSGEHSVGEVPISILYARRSQENRGSLCADSMLGDLVNIDRSIYNQLSLLHEQIYLQTFSQLFIPDDGSAAWSSVDTGPGTAILYNATNGSPLMLAPDHNVVRAQWDLIANMLAMARQLAGVSRGRSELSLEERSGVALNVEMEDKHNQVATLASHTEEFDKSLHRHVAAWEGIPEEEIPEINYSRDVSIKALSQRITDATAIRNLGIPEGSLKSLYKPILMQALQEHGQSKRTIEDAMRIIDDIEGSVLPEVQVSDSGRADAVAGETKTDEEV